MLIVDDNSPDGTGALAEAAAAEFGQIKVLHRPGKQGLGSRLSARLPGRARRGLRDHRLDGRRLLPRSDDDPGAAATASSPVPMRWSVRATCQAAERSTGRSHAASCRAGAIDTPPVSCGCRFGTAPPGSGPIERRRSRHRPEFHRRRGLRLPHRTRAAAGSRRVQGRRSTRSVFVDREYGILEDVGHIVRESMLLVTRWGIRDLWQALRRRTDPPAAGADAPLTGSLRTLRRPQSRRPGHRRRSP